MKPLLLCLIIAVTVKTTTQSSIPSNAATVIDQDIGKPKYPSIRHLNYYYGCSSSLLLIPGQSVKIQSKDYPKDYPRGWGCHWYFQGDTSDTVIDITCQVFNLESSFWLPWWYWWSKDHMAIYNVDYWWFPKRFYKNNKPQNIRSKSNWAYIKFISSHKGKSTNPRRFQCTITAVSTKPTPAPTTTTPAPTTTTPAPTTTTPAPTTTTPAPTTTTPAPTTTTPAPTTTTPAPSTTTPAPTTTTPAPTTTTPAPSTTTPAPTTTTPAPTTTTPAPTSTTTILTTTPVSCKCGRLGLAAGKIVGGVNAEPHQYPWQGGLVESANTKQVVCGAVLIDDHHLLTAAHCAPNPGQESIYKVALAEHDTSTADGVTVHAEIEKITVHPNYDPNTLDNDVAIIKLKNPVDLSKNTISPVCLPDNNNANLVDKTATVTGWGLLSTVGSQPSILQTAAVTTILNSDCSALYDPDFTITENMICAADNGTDSCQGDSGGPLTIPDGDKQILIGLVSFGVLCADPRFPGVYVRIPNYLDWIKSNSGGTIPCSG